MRPARVVVASDDLIWADRLARMLDLIEAAPARAKTEPELERELACADAVVVDLSARSFDPIVAIERSSEAGYRVLALGQHDDLAQRRRALAAGAERVFAYRKIFEDGPTVLRAWLTAGEARP